VDGGEIVITLPDSIYSVTYYKSPQGSYLCARMLPTTYDLMPRRQPAEWKLANAKAHELGCIM
jgi:hypothetical protein